jgi:hypothetical protein
MVFSVRAPSSQLPRRFPLCRACCRRFSLTRAPPCHLPARRGIPALPSSDRAQSPARRVRSSSLRTRRAQPCPYARRGRSLRRARDFVAHPCAPLFRDTRAGSLHHRFLKNQLRLFAGLILI